MDNDVFQIRRSMRDAIFVLLEKRNPLPTDDASKAKCLDAVAKRLEELIFKMAMTKEEYLNPSTLESRLKSLIIGRVSAEPTMKRLSPTCLETFSLLMLQGKDDNIFNTLLQAASALLLYCYLFLNDSYSDISFGGISFWDLSTYLCLILIFLLRIFFFSPGLCEFTRATSAVQRATLLLRFEDSIIVYCMLRVATLRSPKE
ncbi:hypothetical protein ARALYDRAFT_312643 [Arabidopsis lyrata subsp. lyrata]|uniref:Uncharacterized protein n=1 Tax=Arabidopsis lyrata subsp. lyrata TaxID=81972 RepID=D7KEI1_ARALL|nr:hypothetical protein ARALYDRAFT_312643 [Arabidopsis lyrata subsp. lyrata]